MARLYADEQFPLPVVRVLREMGHDVLTVQEADNLGGSDPEVLAFATATNRVVLTHNRRHFIRLHTQSSGHAGILVCTTDQDVQTLAERINRAIANQPTFDSQLIRVTRAD